jgi:hypothetical protein
VPIRQQCIELGGIPWLEIAHQGTLSFVINRTYPLHFSTWNLKKSMTCRSTTKIYLV